MFQTLNLNDARGKSRAAGATRTRMDSTQMIKSYPLPLPNKDLSRFVASTSRIIFSSGTHDPWSSQSVNKSLSDSLLYVAIQGGAHHSDLGGPSHTRPRLSRHTRPRLSRRTRPCERHSNAGV